MNRYEAMQIFAESKKEAIDVHHISITRTTRAVKMIFSKKHDITFFIYEGEISKIEECNGRELIERWVK